MNEVLIILPWDRQRETDGLGVRTLPSEATSAEFSSIASWSRSLSLIKEPPVSQEKDTNLRGQQLCSDKDSKAHEDCLCQDPYSIHQNNFLLTHLPRPLSQRKYQELVP